MMVSTGILIAVLVVCLIGLLILMSRHRKLSTMQQLLHDQLQESMHYQDEALVQLKQQLQNDKLLHSKSDQYLQQLKELVLQLQTNQQQQLDVITELNNKVLLLEQENQPNPLYTRAKKMIELGADVEEVIQECEISRSEAQLLVSMHRQNKTA